MTAISPGALVVAWLALTGLLLLGGITRVAAADLLWHAAFMGLVAAGTWTPRVPAWLRAWLPVAVIALLYAELPTLQHALGHRGTFDDTVIGWERALIGGFPAADLARRWQSLALSELLHGAYLSYYVIVIGVPLHLALRRRKDFDEAVFVLLFSFMLCYAIFLAFPVEGPRYRGAAPAPPGPVRDLARWLLEGASSRGTAFPSSHVAVAVTQCVLAVRYFGAPGALWCLPGAGLALGAVYGGFHYAVDAIAGAAFGGFTTAAGLIVARRPGARAQANATAPM